MNINDNELIISTPGRICLFGEHQDYLGLPVVASAISLRIFIEGSPRKDNVVKISLPDLEKTESFELNGRLVYNSKRDYFKSSINVLSNKGFTFSHGFQCIVHGEIPINAGTSSSSALIVTWINFLARMSDQAVSLTPEEIAELAYKAEVEEFSEPGGMMDHYSTAMGNIIMLESYPKVMVTKIKKNLGAFVLGNSGEPKDTVHILSRVKNEIIKISDNLKSMYQDFSLRNLNVNDAEKFMKHLQPVQYDLLEGTIINHQLTEQAVTVFNNNILNRNLLGDLMYKHQVILRDILKISTPKIDKMVEAAMEAGAYGAKINGSGGGGCMFAYAPDDPEQVLEAIKKISDEAYIIYSADGTREEIMEKI